MVVTKKPTALPVNTVPRLLTQVAACRAALAHSFVRAPANTRKAKPKTLIKAFCLSALSLPGMLSQAQADTDEEVGYQLNHYEESVRPLVYPVTTLDATGSYVNLGQVKPLINQYKPLTADTEHAFARFRLNDRTRVAFDFNHDVWSGATPLSTRPLLVGGFGPNTAAAGYMGGG
ncbi:hypothetical protein [Methylomonas sp. AM2-LC]|uniref:hypothetical protein n=1 Tax=Methylomonas sp. AM2-LC TaxID=3153301 RepID=UPI00326363BA